MLAEGFLDGIHVFGVVYSLVIIVARIFQVRESHFLGNLETSIVCKGDLNLRDLGRSLFSLHFKLNLS